MAKRLWLSGQVNLFRLFLPVVEGFLSRWEKRTQKSNPRPPLSSGEPVSWPFDQSLRQAPITRLPGLCRSADRLQDTVQGRSLAKRMQKKHVLIFSLVSATALLGLVVLLHGDHASEEDELIARRNIFGFNEYAPNAYTRPGVGAYMYNPPRTFAAPPSGQVILRGVPKHTLGVMIPLKDLDKSENVQEENSHEIEVLRKEEDDLKAEDRKTLEKTGNQLGALMRKMTALIRTNVMLR
jgi:hypothetical protein